MRYQTEADVAIVEAMNQTKKLGLSQEVQSSVEKTLREDPILPTLKLGSIPKVIVRFEKDEEEVSVQIGQRDWTWDKMTGEKTSSGTSFF